MLLLAWLPPCLPACLPASLTRWLVRLDDWLAAGAEIIVLITENTRGAPPHRSLHTGPRACLLAPQHCLLSAVCCLLAAQHCLLSAVRWLLWPINGIVATPALIARSHATTASKAGLISRLICMAGSRRGISSLAATRKPGQQSQPAATFAQDGNIQTLERPRMPADVHTPILVTLRARDKNAGRLSSH